MFRCQLHLSPSSKLDNRDQPTTLSLQRLCLLDQLGLQTLQRKPQKDMEINWSIL
jgi:hypothetical protein